MAPSQMALRSLVYHFYYTHLHFHISYLHFLCRYKSESLWLIRPLCAGPGDGITAYRTLPPTLYYATGRRGAAVTPSPYSSTTNWPPRYIRHYVERKGRGDGVSFRREWVAKGERLTAVKRELRIWKLFAPPLFKLHTPNFLHDDVLTLLSFLFYILLLSFLLFLLSFTTFFFKSQHTSIIYNIFNKA